MGKWIYKSVILKKICLLRLQLKCVHECSPKFNLLENVLKSILALEWEASRKKFCSFNWVPSPLQGSHWIAISIATYFYENCDKGMW